MSKISIIGPGEQVKAPQTEEKKKKPIKVYVSPKERHGIEERMKLRQFSAMGPYLLFCEQELSTTQEQIARFKAYLKARHELEAALMEGI